ncbi:TetR/AcrR family transcriptional regulator [Paenibacillus sp. NPDC057967]|uniref:TetR/AcrR family transcriptional regulator n=1 Tax=Paenibacillus sp. NPDC057967 TaxID=3346293 RepID=UPI0036DB3B59
MPNVRNDEPAEPRKVVRRRRGEQKEQLRRLILQTASEMFLELGYHDFSMRKLAARVGYSVATLYLYFRDKDDLLFTVVDDAFTLFRNQLTEAAGRSTDPWERLSQLGEAYVRFGLNNPAYYRLMFMWRIDYLIESRAGEDGPRIEAFQVLVDSVQEAMNQGEMQQEESAAYSDVLWAMLHGIVSLAIQMPMFDEERTIKLVTQAKNMIYKAFHA